MGQNEICMTAGATKIKSKSCSWKKPKSTKMKRWRRIITFGISEPGSWPWPSARVAASKCSDDFSALCPRCGLEPETDLHFLWTCPANGSLTDVAVTSSNKNIDQAVQQVYEYPCLWLRRILPKELVWAPEPAVSFNLHFKVGHADSGIWPSGTYFGDGAGGQYSSYPSIRRCGVGLACYQQDGILDFVCHTPLPGSIHTVPYCSQSRIICSLSCCLQCLVSGSSPLHWRQRAYYYFAQ